MDNLIPVNAVTSLSALGLKVSRAVPEPAPWVLPELPEPFPTHHTGQHTSSPRTGRI